MSSVFCRFGGIDAVGFCCGFLGDSVLFTPETQGAGAAAEVSRHIEAREPAATAREMLQLGLGFCGFIRRFAFHK